MPTVLSTKAAPLINEIWSLSCKICDDMEFDGNLIWGLSDRGPRKVFAHHRKHKSSHFHPFLVLI